MSGHPDWGRAVREAQAPQLPSAVPPPPLLERRFNQVHGFHGEFGTSGGSKQTNPKFTQAAIAEKGGQNENEQGEAQQKAQLLAEASRLEALAKNDREQAANIQVQLNAVLAQLQSLTQPFPTSQNAATSAGSIGNTSGTPSTSAAATGTPSTSAQATGTAQLGSSTTSYADQIATLQGQASAFTTQINNLNNQAANYESQATSLRAQAAAIK